MGKPRATGHHQPIKNERKTNTTHSLWLDSTRLIQSLSVHEMLFRFYCVWRHIAFCLHHQHAWSTRSTPSKLVKTIFHPPHIKYSKSDLLFLSFRQVHINGRKTKSIRQFRSIERHDRRPKIMRATANGDSQWNCQNYWLSHLTGRPGD